MKKLLPILLAAVAVLATFPTWAQAPAWSQATQLGLANGICQVASMAADASGNLFVAGTFQGQLVLGVTTLTSAGGTDLFVAKYLPATGTWAWAQSGGGTSGDYAYDLAVSGSSVYVVGGFTNSAGNANGVLMGGTGPGSSTVRVNGASPTASSDLLLAKYTDNGTSATLNWTQVGGGTDYDYASGVAVSGSSVYVLGTYTNTSSNSNAVVLGGNGTAAGTTPVNGLFSYSGTSALLLAKYTDNGATGTLGWTQVGGSPGLTFSKDVAVQGTAVYITGGILAGAASGAAALFGGNGTTAGTALQYGANATISIDLLLAKYTDNGTSGSFGWSQVGGGTGFDTGQGVAVSGSSVYVLGTITNDRANAQSVLFGGSGTTAGTRPQYGATATSSQDLVLAKYTDNGATGTLGWTQVGGGTDSEYGFGVAANGSGVYIAGALVNTTTNANGVLFGGSGTTAGTATVSGVSTVASGDVLVARYQDNGPAATLSWAQVGGGAGADQGTSLALTGQQLYVAGSAVLPAAFGNFALAGPTTNGVPVLARLPDTALPTRAAGGGPAFTLYPNPAPRTATLSGMAPGALVQAYDVQGRLVLSARANAAGTAALVFSSHLPAGLYLVREAAGASPAGQALRLVLE